MGRSAGPKKVPLIFRIREELLAELYLKRPELQDATGHTKYGAITRYFESLVRRDLDQHHTPTDDESKAWDEQREQIAEALKK